MRQREKTCHNNGSHTSMQKYLSCHYWGDRWQQHHLESYLCPVSERVLIELSVQGLQPCTKALKSVTHFRSPRSREDSWGPGCWLSIVYHGAGNRLHETRHAFVVLMFLFPLALGFATNVNCLRGRLQRQHLAITPFDRHIDVICSIGCWRLLQCKWN